MSEDDNVLFQFLPPMGQFCYLPRFIHIQVAVGDPYLKAFQPQIAVRLCLYRPPHSVTVAADSIYLLSCNVVHRIGVGSKIPAVDPAFHRRCRCQNLTYCRQTSVCIAEYSYFHVFVFSIPLGYRSDAATDTKTQNCAGITTYAYLFFYLIFFQLEISFFTAFPRWLILFFSSAVASPNPL